MRRRSRIAVGDELLVRHLVVTQTRGQILPVAFAQLGRLLDEDQVVFAGHNLLRGFLVAQPADDHLAPIRECVVLAELPLRTDEARVTLGNHLGFPGDQPGFRERSASLAKDQGASVGILRSTVEHLLQTGPALARTSGTAQEDFGLP